MTAASDTDRWLIDRIRQRDEAAWRDLIGRYEGRLYAFAQTRLRDPAVSQEIVQETFVGFLKSLPNYDDRRTLESYLFSICAYKLTDHLRHEGRRPTISLSSPASSSGDIDLPARQPGSSSIVRSGERRGLEEKAIVAALRDQIAHWRGRGEWRKLQCAELLFVRGWANKQVAAQLELSEQQVANYKFEFIARLGRVVREQKLDAAVFPELQAAECPPPDADASNPRSQDRRR